VFARSGSKQHTINSTQPSVWCAVDVVTEERVVKRPLPACLVGTDRNPSFPQQHREDAARRLNEPVGPSQRPATAPRR